MPIVHEYTYQRGKHHIKANVEGKVVTFQVSAAGEDYLRKNRFVDGSKLTWRQFNSLRSKNYLYTDGSGTAAQEASMPPPHVLTQNEEVLRFFDGFGKGIEPLPSSLVSSEQSSPQIFRPNNQHTTALPDVIEWMLCPHCGVKLKMDRLGKHQKKCPKLIQDRPIASPPPLLTLPLHAPAVIRSDELDHCRTSVNTAMLQLYRRDGLLLEAGMHERAISHRLALYLEALFPDWNVDCGYGGNEPLPDRIIALKRYHHPSGHNEATVYPDIVVHRRSTDRRLLLVETRRVSLGSAIDEYDRCKIESYVEEYGFQYGLWVAFNYAKQDAALSWFRMENGKCVMIEGK